MYMNTFNIKIYMNIVCFNVCINMLYFIKIFYYYYHYNMQHRGVGGLGALILEMLIVRLGGWVTSIRPSHVS